MRVPSYAIPGDVHVLEAERNRIAEMNSVFRCVAKSHGETFRFYLKVSKSLDSGMANEEAVLEELRGYGFPVPKVLWSGTGRRHFMAVEERPGHILRDILNPFSPQYGGNASYDVLQDFGELVGRLHSLPIDWADQRRTALYDFLGEREVEDESFQQIVAWLDEHPPPSHDAAFVHGDLNDANVLVEGRDVTAILDWESAGRGWKEYDLAWVLRERRNYMNTREARLSFLEGYTTRASYDPYALRWCEVMNCLHVAFWCKDKYPNFMEFNLQKAREAMERPVE